MVIGRDFDTNITRFTLPVCALAFNERGSMMAAAGDDEDGIYVRVNGNLKSFQGIRQLVAFSVRVANCLDSISALLLCKPRHENLCDAIEYIGGHTALSVGGGWQAQYLAY
ncbi:hypothetical protein ACFE04_023874 [Oxalis oulophora]